MEDYAAKMARKTDAELRLYLAHRSEYLEQAVLAALTELEQRGQAVPDAAALRPELEAAAQTAAAEAALRPAVEAPWQQTRREQNQEEAEPATKPEGELPLLYSQSTVAMFSVFSFLVGSVLMVINLLKLRRYGGAALLMSVVLVVISNLGWLATSLQMHPLTLWFMANVVSALIYAYLLWPSLIGAQPYQPRRWWSPLLVMLIIGCINLLFMVLMGMPLPSLNQ